MTPRRRAESHREKLEALPIENSPDIRNAMRQEQRQLDAEAGLMLRVTEVDAEAGLILCETESKRPMTVRVPLNPAEVERDLIAANPTRKADIARRVASVIASRMQMLRTLVAGAFVHLVSQPKEEASGVWRVANVRACDPPRKDPRTAPAPAEIAPFMAMPPVAQTKVRQALGQVKAANPNPTISP